MIPLHHLRRQGLIGGRDFDACCMIDGNHLAFGLDGTLPAGSTRVIETTEPYDHCNFTISPGAPREEVARGALVEAGSPSIAFNLRTRDEIWARTAGDLYRQAAAVQWDPQTAIDWDARFDLAPAIEAAVVQVMTYLIENENAALVVPARHLGQVHPHYREVQQVLAKAVSSICSTSSARPRPTR